MSRSQSNTTNPAEMMQNTARTLLAPENNLIYEYDATKERTPKNEKVLFYSTLIRAVHVKPALLGAGLTQSGLKRFIT